MAAFGGYCAGAAFANAWAGKLGEFKEFYRIPGADEKDKDDPQDWADLSMKPPAS
jgi:hypothetical protein